ncbi:ferredoxin [Streptomyces sp. NBC_01320]|uniref:ferredoxin n=1 Tax=Streptomyces sp. NBC_01320 TaxID=2903824 RepID=UPI002E0D2D52|nr:ferredoxin [Streptomyces sp. NBC_01320]
MMIDIEILQDRCIGAGNCAEVAPKYFDLDDEGLVVALHNQIEPGDEAETERAVDMCPAVAILLHQSK